MYVTDLTEPRGVDRTFADLLWTQLFETFSLLSALFCAVAQRSPLNSSTPAFPDTGAAAPAASVAAASSAVARRKTRVVLMCSLPDPVSGRGPDGRSTTPRRKPGEPYEITSAEGDAAWRDAW